MKPLLPLMVVPLMLILALSACRQESAQDITPLDMSAETLGHFCQMNLAEHPGPKAQVHLEGMPGMPLYFSQVRDGIAYTRMPEQSHPILAFYVNDMGAAGASWDDPGTGNWIAADQAWFVVGSPREGGMGAPETVPFSSREAAQDFAAAEGGEVLRLDAIPDDLVLAPAAAGLSPDGPDAADDEDYEERLRALSRPTGG